MAFTADSLSAVDAAIASGKLTVRYGGREVTYRSLQELKEARALILQELATTDQPTRSRQWRGVGSKGFGTSLRGC